jgi:hypothetical protein
LEKAAFPVFGDGGARHRDAGVAAGEPADILLVDGKIVSWDATLSISDALASATDSGKRYASLRVLPTARDNQGRLCALGKFFRRRL